MGTTVAFGGIVVLGDVLFDVVAEGIELIWVVLGERSGDKGWSVKLSAIVMIHEVIVLTLE